MLTRKVNAFNPLLFLYKPLAVIKTKKMKIKFVNHSSFIIEHDDISIISDPWLEGKVFNNGWDLISKTKLSYDDFKDINYIWFCFFT